MTNIKHLFIHKLVLQVFIYLTFSVSLCFSQAPVNYYSGYNGLTGDDLREHLFHKIDGHNVRNYSALWSDFYKTDLNSNGDIWDMYSHNPSGSQPYIYQPGSDQCGQYNSEGDCYNREHSFPSSWFNDSDPMRTDLFHVYPTDGYVNGNRSDLPYGEVGSISFTSDNGSLRGDNIYPGYNGAVFEPIDEYKGDFARSYFYMVTRYKNKVTGWSSPMLQGDNLAPWAVNMLIAWSLLDPVSTKETERNDEIYKLQGNRNPYIDNPEWAVNVFIWPSDVMEVNENEEFHLFIKGNSVNVLKNSIVNSYDLKIYNSMGQLMLTKENLYSDWSSNSSLQTGAYIIHLDGGGKFIEQKRFIIMR